MEYPKTIEQLIATLPLYPKLHVPKTEFYEASKKMARLEIERLFLNSGEKSVDFNPFGKLVFPYVRMGSVDSLNLFDFDELILFSFYWKNRKRYHRAGDIGANIGLHSIILEKCGLEVYSYEPDPKHFEILQKNLKLNHTSRVKAFNVAVSDKAGTAEFIRLLGNTTGSHLAGAKPNAYGEMEHFFVKTESIHQIISRVDLLKIDVEGHEKDVLLATSAKEWETTDGLVEVGNTENAKYIFDHFKKIGVSLFSQKIGWQLVRELEQVPTSYHEGLLFITRHDKMPW